MSHSGGRQRGDSSENYYHFVWDDSDLETLDQRLPASRARERVAQILKETELPDEELEVFTIPKSHRRVSAKKSPDTANFAENTFSFDQGGVYTASALPGGQQVVETSDSLGLLGSMHGYTEDCYVEISGQTPEEGDSWSSDGRGQGDGASDRTLSKTTHQTTPNREHSQNNNLPSVRFTKFRSDLGQLEDNYIDDDEFEPEYYEGSIESLGQPQFDAQGNPIARAVLPMDMEMSMESEDDEALLDIERAQDLELRSDTSDTQPIVFRLDQAQLSHEFKRRRRKFAVIAGIVIVSCGALGAIIFLVVHFLQ